ncbi:MAG: hypothetical protein KDI27_09425 [Gammaproteobacteria bacterium]|nr:hypothetical protein [Gammaproteobacteria bacterium]
MTLLTEPPKKLPIYTLGAIPDCWIWPGQVLAFHIDTRSLDGQMVTLSFDDSGGPQPRGPCLLAADGDFLFEPAAEDSQPLALIFRGVEQGSERIQQCIFTPLPALPAERDRLAAGGDLPSPASTLYLATTVTHNADESENHTVSGVRMVFDRENDENGLMARYHVDRSKASLPNEPTTKGTIHALTLIADEIVICGELSLPETNLSLFARRLVFRPQAACAGRIDTSPLSYKLDRAANSAHGAHGRKGGDITVYAGVVEGGYPSGIKFSTRGSNGQSAGYGKDGAKGDDNTQFIDQADYGSLHYSFDPPAIHFDLLCCAGGTHGMDEDSWHWGSLTWPTSGESADPPGIPGNAGHGGRFISNQSLTVAYAPALLQRYQEEMASTKALSILVEGWVFDYLYVNLQQRDYAKMLSVTSRQYLQRLKHSIEQLGVSFASTIQSAQQQQATDMSEALMLAKASLDSVTPDVAKLEGIFDRYHGHNTPIKESRSLAKELLSAAAHFRERLQAIETQLPREFRGEVTTHGGVSGAMAKDVSGGEAGYPTDCANYDIRCYDGFDFKLHRSWQHIKERRTTTEGKSYTAQPAQIAVGETGPCQMHSSSDYRNAWIHPVLVQTVLIYLRDAYLGAPEKIDQLRPLATAYHRALAMPSPDAIMRSVVEAGGGHFDETAYHHAQVEFATLNHRMASHLDYYGNPLGWTPLFSLPLCLGLYEGELDYGLKTLLLSRWIAHKAITAEEISRIAGQSIESLYRATDQAVTAIGEQQVQIKSLNDQAQTLQQEIVDLNVKLDHKRSELLGKAEKDARIKSWVNFGVNTISAISQVIPYGQPALGALGSMGKTLADNIINENDPIEALGPMSDLLGGLLKAKLDDQAGQIVAAAKEQQKARDKPDQAADAVAKLTHVGQSIGPALNQISRAVQALSVPREEIDSRLQKLEAECPEFQEMLRDLRALNLHKIDFAHRLAETLQSLAASYAQVTNNLLSVSALQVQRRRQLEKLSHEALLYVKDMEQRARATLVKYLYYLAKSGEYALFKPVPVDYQLTEVTERILPLLEENEQTPKDIELLTTTLATLFKSQMHEVEKLAFQHFEMEYEDTVELRLSQDQTATTIEHLNRTGEVVIDLRAFNCVWPGHEQARIADVQIEEIRFDTRHRPLPDHGTVELTLEPRGEGTMRSGNALYITRHPTSESSASSGRDSQQLWGARYHFGSNGMEPVKPSDASLALLDYLLRETNQSIREKFARPAAWTGVTVRYVRHVPAPDIESMRMKLKLYSRQADRHYVSLDVRTEDPQQAPLIECGVTDVNGRSHGFGDIYRIYPRGQRIQLKAPVSYGMYKFSHWVIVDNAATMETRQVFSSSLDIDAIEYDMILYYHYAPQALAPAVVKDPAAVLQTVRDRLKQQFTDETRQEFARIAQGVASPGDALPLEVERAIRDTVAQTQQVLTAANPVVGTLQIFDRPVGRIIAFVPEGASFTDLQETTQADHQDWLKIDYRGVVGWVKHQ